MNDYVLTAAEWSVMECLWDHSPRSGREAVEYLSAGVGWSRSTTLTMLRRMDEKGLITSCEDADGIRVYSPNIDREDATMQQTEDFLHRIYHGSIGMMLSAFTKKQSLSQKEIDELYAILDNVKEGTQHE